VGCGGSGHCGGKYIGRIGVCRARHCPLSADNQKNQFTKFNLNNILHGRKRGGVGKSPGRERPTLALVFTNSVDLKMIHGEIEGMGQREEDRKAGKPSKVSSPEPALRKFKGMRKVSNRACGVLGPRWLWRKEGGDRGKAMGLGPECGPRYGCRWGETTEGQDRLFKKRCWLPWGVHTRRVCGKKDGRKKSKLPRGEGGKKGGVGVSTGCLYRTYGVGEKCPAGIRGSARMIGIVSLRVKLSPKGPGQTETTLS